MAVERQREYETIYILRPDSNDDDVTTVRERLEGVVENAGGHLLKFDDWGQRDLAYEIQDTTESRRFDRAVYHYYRYLGPSEVVAEIERNLRLIDTVLKFMTVKIEDNLIPEERLNRPEEEEEEPLPYQGEEE
jgi:small subunit ribosomal protein S6